MDLFHYSLLESSPSIKSIHPWEKVFPINYSSGVGVCLQEPVFEIKEDDTFFMYRCTQHEDISSHNTFDKLNRVDHLSSNMTMLVKKDGNEDRVIFFTWLRLCNSCNRKVDALRMKPITQNMVFKLPTEDTPMAVPMTFYPGVTSEFRMKTDSFLCQAKHLIYFSNFIKVERNTCAITTLHPHARAHSTLEYCEDKASALDPWAPPKIMYNGMSGPIREKMTMEPDMTLVSSDMKIFMCHKFILSCRSEIFRVIIKEAEGKTKLAVLMFDVEESATSVDAFLKFIYFPNNAEPLESLSFEHCCGVFELACKSQAMNLIGVVSWVLVRKLERLGFENLRRVQNLSSFLQTMGNIQLVEYVKYGVFYTILRLQRLERMSRTVPTLQICQAQ